MYSRITVPVPLFCVLKLSSLTTVGHHSAFLCKIATLKPSFKKIAAFFRRFCKTSADQDIPPKAGHLKDEAELAEQHLQQHEEEVAGVAHAAVLVHQDGGTVDVDASPSSAPLEMATVGGQHSGQVFIKVFNIDY